jgi:hypothetical protein
VLGDPLVALLKGYPRFGLRRATALPEKQSIGNRPIIDAISDAGQVFSASLYDLLTLEKKPLGLPRTIGPEDVFVGSLVE